MLEKEDLQAIARLMEQQRKDIMSDVSTMMSQQRKDLMHDVTVLIDAEITPKFNLLAENQQIMMEKLDRLDELEEQMADVRATLDVHGAVLAQHSREIQKLKKAQ